ncbi:MAG: SagB/ThcOx family dehydrogenase, partial [Steroidobacteraceae bacterium]
MNSLEYHNSTKHTPDSVRRAARPLDWANMPDPFRNYEGAPLIDLPADPPPPAVAALEVLRGSPCPLTTGDPIAFLSQLLFYSAAISAAKKTPSGDRYALRVNPSSGNLHPTEFHFASPGGRFHYRVSAHMLERRARGDAGPLCFLLTTIVWREAWKYGSRAYRYCLLDAGHAWQALALAASAIGCEASATGRFADDEVAAAYALSPDEWPLLLVHVPHAPVLAPGGERIWAGGVPNRLSEQAVSYPSIELAHAAAKVSLDAPDRLAAPLAPSSASVASPGTGPSFGEVVRRRRSALDFRAAGSMSQQQLSVLLDLATRPLAADFSSPSFIELYVY